MIISWTVQSTFTRGISMRTRLFAVLAIALTLVGLTACGAPEGWSNDNQYFKVSVVPEKGNPVGQSAGKCIGRTIHFDESYKGDFTYEGDHYTIDWSDRSKGSSQSVTIYIHSARPFISGFVTIKDHPKDIPFVLPLAMSSKPVETREIAVDVYKFTGSSYDAVTAVTLCEDPKTS